MKHIGMTLAAVVVGSVLLTAGQAGACEGHRAKAEAVPAPVEPGKQEKAAQAETAPKQDKADELHSAKCRCSSAADCTCKKGSCECAKCKKPRQDVAAPLKEAALPVRSAGVLI
ncbi:metallothionein [Archangium lansingense]|uniref:Metallothionein n=1 Tax=Archangium lansingense TaxID=2995310 RepID=A0ABT4A572_9BACT|nr:metallothionein [Archangium lansinium]MCY1076506.1 metallothionein [Archangium lansinium]